jgi:SAM-dependent methyltransferase
MDSQEWIYGQLACPACKQPLTKAIDLLICNGCSTAYQQTDERFIDLMLPDKDLLVDEAWKERLKQMDAWYDDLVSHPESAKRLLDNDFSLFPKEIFSGPGPVLDVGGGSGHTRNFLYPGTRYICLDPDLNWIRPEWTSIADQGKEAQGSWSFVKGVGEHLPFPSGTFQRVYSFWSLNHSIRPELVVQEAARVLKPGGEFFLVLEDMHPRFSDIPGRLRFALSDRYWTKRYLECLLHLLKTGEWPLQNDHIRINESDLAQWSEGHFAISTRHWYGDYLTFRMTKPLAAHAR